MATIYHINGRIPFNHIYGNRPFIWLNAISLAQEINEDVYEGQPNEYEVLILLNAKAEDVCYLIAKDVY